MKIAYNIFLMIELAKVVKVINSELPYDETFDLGVALYSEFENSKYNDENIPEYECILSFLKDKFNSFDEKIKIENSNSLIVYSKNILKQNGYFVDNLWMVDDVKSKFICDDKTAQKILYSALTDETIMQEIWGSINEVGRDKFRLTNSKNEDDTDLIW